MTPLERITARVTRLGHPDLPGVPSPLLTVEEFFEGNSVVGSIGCNLEGAPSPGRFYELFKKIANRDDVRDIRVQITMFDDPAWPFSDTVFVMTLASPEMVASWFPDDLRPTEIAVGFPTRIVFEPYTVPADAQPILCWWD